MGLFFFPRGGSAYVARYLSGALSSAGWDVSLVSGSLGGAGAPTHAATFFRGVDVHAMDYCPASGGPVTARSPISYEDRAGAPDVVLASVDPGLADAVATVWEPPFAAAGTTGADVVHLHHLTPQHDAVARGWPNVPVLAHLHGTELKFIEAIEARAALAAALGTTLAAVAEAEDGHDFAAVLDGEQDGLTPSTRGGAWRHGMFWAARLRKQARAADHLIAVSSRDRATAIELLDLEPDRISVIPNGVDLDLFGPRTLTRPERRAAFRRWLVEDPRGWNEGGSPGTVTYGERDLDRLLGTAGDATVLIYVGRFTAAKRVPALIRAFARARDRFERPGSLVVWGGSPGEWEDEHPLTVAGEVGADGIFFTGWRGHDDLPFGLAAADALVMSSVDDSYPQAPLEAMAIGLPVIATRSGGFPSIVDMDGARPTGWLVAPDDVNALADALAEAVNRPAELGRRGANALVHARARFSWNGLVPHFEDAYAAAIEHHADQG